MTEAEYGVAMRHLAKRERARHAVVWNAHAYYPNAPVDEETFIQVWDTHTTVKDVARALDISLAAVYERAKRLGLTPKQRRRE